MRMARRPLLTVVPDITPPSLVNAINLGATNIQLVFSEGVSAPTATTPANYKVTGGVTVTAAAFGALRGTVPLRWTTGVPEA